MRGEMKMGFVRRREALIVLLLSLMIGFEGWQIFNSKRLATVDLQYLVKMEAESLAKLYPKGKVPEVKIQANVNRLKEITQIFAEKNKIILLSKNAVLGGSLPDYTDVILEQLEKNDEEANP